MHNNNDTCISCSNEALHKRQATMHVFMNKGKGDKRDSHTALICKGSCEGRCKAIEQLAHDKRVPILF